MEKTLDTQVFQPSQDLSPMIPPPLETQGIESASGLYEIIADDVIRFNFLFKSLSIAWSQATTIDEVCKLALTSAKLMEQRRKALLKQWGTINIERGSGWLEPLDG